MNQADPLGQVMQESAIIPHTAQQGAYLLQIPRHGHFDQCGDFSRFRTHAVGRNGIAQKFSIRGPQAGLRGGELEVMLAQALEERLHCLDVSRRVGVENDHIVEVGHHLEQALCNFVNDFDELPGRSAAALGHDEPLIEVHGSAKRRERNGILVHSNLMERRNQVEQRKHSSLAQRVQDLVHAGGV